ncbi:hypothetical protein K402DRAFT_339982 [Aulographum hederae CBS 113979]|uniref:t-SNARE coiled-coil homology domain-containing protein n=1 Tax=Aulographum hederae CBS 113979 TaxID=1176131 RepID=A0A6G1GNW0_9PEZI|nr:hypothetical protein K402DRAFT_339982 [Aulographum hederae CBS 113979]
MDLTPTFSDLLVSHNGTALRRFVFQIEDLNEFLKEAYRINAHITELSSYLHRIRAPYLSTTRPSARRKPTTSSSKENDPLTDPQRAEIDASTRQLLHTLSNAITSLASAESTRLEAEKALWLKSHPEARLSALGRWAAGGGATKKAPVEEEEDARREGVKVCRENVIWFLRQRLRMAGEVWRGMAAVRLERETERNKSVLFKAKGGGGAGAAPAAMGGGDGGFGGRGEANGGVRGTQGMRVEEMDRGGGGGGGGGIDLSDEQMQLFAKENQDMLKHYEDTLEQVQTAQASILEISSLQTTLAENLTLQNAQIDYLVADSYQTHENVGSGNKELKRASERKSTARMVFYSTCGLCAFLVVWDLLI